MTKVELKRSRGHVVSFSIEGPTPPFAYASFFDGRSGDTEIPPTQGSIDRLIDWSDRDVELSEPVQRYLRKQDHKKDRLLPLQDYFRWDDLHDHQKKFVHFTLDNAAQNAGRARVINADDARLGKSIETIASVESLYACKGSTAPVLVLCPKSTMYQWKHYFQGWGNKPSFIIGGETTSRQSQINDILSECSNAIIITNYYTARALELHKKKWFALVVDEAHALKNRKSQISNSVGRIARNCHHVFLLSATFVERSPADWWSPLHIIDPKLHTSYWRWFGWFVEFEEDYFGIKPVGARNTDLMRDFVGDVVIQRRSDDVVNMPPKIVEPYYIELDEQHRGIYQSVMADRSLDGLQKVMKLRQATIHPAMINGDWRNPQISKLNALSDLIENRVGDAQVIVFSSFINGCRAAAWAINGRKSNTATVFAGPDAKTAELERFQDGDVKVLCTTPQKGGIGLNLYNADWAVFLDMPWSTVQIRQSEERVRAINKRGSVYVVRMVAVDTIDEFVYRHVLSKLDSVTESEIVQRVLTEFKWQKS